MSNDKLLCALVVTAVLNSGGWLFGQEVQPEPNAATAPPHDVKSISGQPQKKSELDDELLQHLQGQQPGSDDMQADDPLELAIRGMRDAAERLQNDDASRSTRDIQDDVVKELEKLINMARQQQRSPSPPAESQQRRQQRSESKQRPQFGQPNANRPASQPQDKPSPKNSAERTDRNQNSAVKLLPRDLERDVWGHLPKRLRDKLRQHYTDKYLPKYDELVRQYFQALAEDGQKAESESTNSGE